VQVNCDNPFLSPSMVQEFCTNLGLGPGDTTTLLIGRRNTEGGGRQDDIGHQAFRVVAGIRGGITDDWRYDAYFQHGKTERASTFLNDFSIVRTTRALQVAIDQRTDPETGEPLNPRPSAPRSACPSWTAPTRTVCPGTSSRRAASRLRPFGTCRRRD
jgi:hypothetical protein